MVFSNDVPTTLGIGAVQQTLAELFSIGYFTKIIFTAQTNPFEEAITLKYTLSPVKNYILNFTSPVQKNFKDKLSDLGFDDERFFEILVPYGTEIVVSDQFLLYVNGITYKMIVVDYKTDLSGLIVMSCKHLPEFIVN